MHNQTHDWLTKELDRMTWSRDSEQREVRLLREKICGLNEEIDPVIIFSFSHLDEFKNLFLDFFSS